MPSALTHALDTFVEVARRLDLVQAKVLRKRARVFHAELAAIEHELEESRSTLAAAEERADEEQRKATLARRGEQYRRVELQKMRIDRDRMRRERDEALAEVERLRAAPNEETGPPAAPADERGPAED